MVDCCLRTDGLGYQIFNVANDDTSVGITSEAVYEQFYPDVPAVSQLTGFDSFYANQKAKRLVGFRPTHGWRHLVG